MTELTYLDKGVIKELKSYCDHLVQAIEMDSPFNVRGLANDIERIARSWADARDAQAHASVEQRTQASVYTEYFPLSVRVEMDSVTVYTNNGYEVIHWVEDEWLEDSSILPAVVNAVVMAYAVPHTLVNMHMPHIKAQEFIDAEIHEYDKE